MPKTFKTWLKENHPEVIIPEKEVPSSWFSENNIPMIVRCTCCESTMVVFSAIVGDDDYIYCSNCMEPES